MGDQQSKEKINKVKKVFRSTKLKVPRKRNLESQTVTIEKHKICNNSKFRCSPEYTNSNDINVLSSYTYFLNSSNTTYISVGFKIYDCTPCVKLCVLNYWMGKDILIFNQEAWTSFTSFESTIRKMFAREMDDDTRNKHLNYLNAIFKQFQINFFGVDNCQSLIISQNNSSVLLSSDEFERICTLSEFVKITLIYNSSVQFYVKNYFEKYIETCKNLGCDKLEPSQYTTSSEHRQPANFFRLFHEISFFCDNINMINSM